MRAETTAMNATARALAASRRPPVAHRPARGGGRGFTLIEVLVVIAISAILLAVGVPMFNGAIASMRASESANSLVASLELARTEAIRRGTTVSLCRVTSADPTACDGSASGAFAAGDWAAGWLVYADLGGSAVGAFNPGDERILIQAAVAAGAAPRSQILRTAGTDDVITFRPDGLRVGGQLVYRIAHPQAAHGVALSCRQITIDGVGRAVASRIPC